PTLAGGDEPLPLSATIDAMERLHDLEELDRSLRGDYPGASIDDVDEDALRQALGEAAVRDLRRLKEIERALERAGLVSRERGRLEVTPKGARSMGERALVRVFEQPRRDRGGGRGGGARPADPPNAPARPGRGGSATPGRSRSSGASSTPSSGAARGPRFGSSPTTSSCSRPNSARR